MFNPQQKQPLQHQPLHRIYCTSLQRILILYVLTWYVFIILNSISVFVVATTIISTTIISTTTTTTAVSFPRQLQQQQQKHLYYYNYYNNKNYYYNNCGLNSNIKNNRRTAFISNNKEYNLVNSLQKALKTRNIRFASFQSKIRIVLYPKQRQRQKQYRISRLFGILQHDDANNNNSNENKNSNIATTNEASTLLLQSSVPSESSSSFVNMTTTTTSTNTITDNNNSIISNNSNTTSKNIILLHNNITIRYCTYNDLPDIATVIVNSFYNNITKNNIFYHMYRMAELNRLQQTYSYGDDILLHRMIVATIPNPVNTNNKNQNKKSNFNNDLIIGYVDIDIRPVTNYNRGTFTYNPRPYLSDLCIEPYYRRYGIAKQLIVFCENYCITLSNDTIQLANNKLKVQQQQSSTKRDRNNIDNPMKDFIIKNNELYIRVEQSNVRAIQMYTNTTLQYKQIYNPDDIAGKDIIILYKQLTLIE